MKLCKANGINGTGLTRSYSPSGWLNMGIRHWSMPSALHKIIDTMSRGRMRKVVAKALLEAARNSVGVLQR
jgi:hypothetical protein